MDIARLLRVLVACCLTLFWGSIIAIAVCVKRLQGGAEVFQRKKRQRPACLDDPDLGVHRTVNLTSQGIRMHYVEKGDKSKPLLLLVHGFPEFWFSWSHQLKDLSMDYWVVAMDLRGYGESDKPEGKCPYDIDTLALDLAGLVHALGRQTCLLAAHDWGGVIAFRLVELRPQLVEKLVILNAPHLHAINHLLRVSWDQLKRSWYVFFFQLPWLPETMLAMDDFKALERMFTSTPLSKRQHPPEVIEAYKYNFREPGSLTPPINYYRQNFSLPGAADGREPARLPCPLLVIWGEKDVALSPLLATMTARYADDFTVRFLKDSSHWVQMDEPEAVNRHMRQFLQKRAD